VDQKIKKNLIIFVTARLMNAEGRPILQQDDEEETVDPIGLPEDLPPPTITTRSSGK
jgi:general secretion pathway protein D